MRCHQFSREEVCVEITEFLDDISNMPIFKTKFNFLKSNMVKKPERDTTTYFFPEILILRDQNHENITSEIFASCWISI